MESDLVVFRRDLPGGHVAILSLDHRAGREWVGRLYIERRKDPARQGGEPPIVAEARGASREAVLSELRRIAESDAEIARRLEAWQGSHRAMLPSMSGFELATPRRLRMADGQWWSAERRHEMAQLRSAREPMPARRVYVFFSGPAGELRRVEVTDDFPPANEAEAAALEALWARAEQLQRDTT